MLEWKDKPENDKLATYFICPDVIMHPVGEKVVASNVFARTHVEANSVGVMLMSFCLEPKSTEEIRRFVECQDGRPEFGDRTWFSNILGLMADPSNLIREPLQPDSLCTGVDDILALLKKRFIFISDDEEYVRIYEKRRNIFDGKRFGNFHQQLGYELRVKRRVDSDQWWLDQKFANEGDDIKENLYKFIQLYFWESLFCRLSLKKKEILDVGCGSGFYSRFLARRGATVVGIDPNKKFIEEALKRNVKEKLDIEYWVLDGSSALEMLADGQFDFVIFQDAFLFYFVPYAEGKLNDRIKVLGALKRVLKASGTMFVIEPHGVFWLSPWLGSAERPFTVITEYAKKCFGVTPSLGEISGAFYEAGFLIKRIIELFPAREAREGDRRGYEFARQFPLWWCFELTK